MAEFAWNLLEFAIVLELFDQIGRNRYTEVSTKNMARFYCIQAPRVVFVTLVEVCSDRSLKIYLSNEA